MDCFLILTDGIRYGKDLLIDLIVWVYYKYHELIIDTKLACYISQNHIYLNKSLLNKYFNQFKVLLMK